MSQIPFNIPALLEGINNRVPIRTPIKNTYFNNVRLLDSCEVQMDIMNGPEGVMCAVAKDAKSNKVNKDVWQSIIFEIFRFTEHCAIKPGDMYGRRRFGSADAKMIGLTEPRQDALETLLRRFDLTTEFLSAGALCGEIKDGCGQTLLKLPINNVGDISLSAGGDDLFEVVFDAKCGFDDVLGDAGGLDIWLGKAAYKKFLASPTVAAIRERFPLEVLNGRLPEQLAEVRFNVLTHSYLAEDGTRERLLDEDAMLIVSRNLDSVMLHGPIEMPDGLLVQQSNLREWVEEDPPVRFMRYESNPMPFIRRPHGVRKYNVL